MKNYNCLASKTWSIQGTSFLPLEKISLHLLNLGVPPGSQEGTEIITTESSKLTQNMKTAIG